MDLPSILAEIKAAQEEFKQSERSLATAIFCQRVDKALDRIVESADNADFEHLVVGILIVVGSFNDVLPHLLDGPLLTQLLDRLFGQCARVVLDIKWQQCDKDTPSQQSFRTSLLTCQQLMAPRGYGRFSVLQTLMDNPWTHPVLSMVMGNEEDNEEGEGLAYIQAQDPEILKLRVELMQQENCDEFALNLCTWCLKHPGLAQDFVLRKTQFVLLHRLNNIDRLQEECQTMEMEASLHLIYSLLGREEHRELCTMLAQTFLVQNWIKPSDNNTKKELLQLWIKLQYQADQDQDRFIASLWAVAKLSHSTQQLLLIIDAVREQCGDTFLQFCLDLCKFAINVDKGCWEKLKEDNASGPKEELLARKQDMAQVCDKISHIVAHVCPKVSFCCALTAFSMTPSEQSLQAVRVAHQRRSQKDSRRSQCCSNCATDQGQCLSSVGGKKDRSQCCSNCATDQGQCLSSVGGEKSSHEVVNVATLYEVERLCGTLRPAYLSSESDFSVLYSMCKQYLQKENGEAVKSALVRRRSSQTVLQQQQSPAGSDSSPAAVEAGSSVPPGSAPSSAPVLAAASRTVPDSVPHIGDLPSTHKADASNERGNHNPGLASPAVAQNSVPVPTPGVQSEVLGVGASASKCGAGWRGQTGNSNPVQQLVLKQLSTDTVQVLLHLIESGQISASLVNHALTNNPGMSLQALNDLISKAKENATAQKLAMAQASQQAGSHQRQPAPAPVHHQSQQQQGHHPQHLTKPHAQPTSLREMMDKHYQQAPVHKEKVSHPGFEAPQSGGLQPARGVVQGRLQQQASQQPVLAPQPHAQPKIGQPQILDSQASASTTRFLTHRSQDSGNPAASAVQGLPHIGSVTVPTLQLTSSGGIQVTQPVHVMTIRQPLTVHSTSSANNPTPIHSAQIVMQSSAHMLTHLSGGSVVAAAQRHPSHILHLPSSSVSFATQHNSKSLPPKTQKLIPKAPGLNTAPHDTAASSRQALSQVPTSSGDINLGNRHYSINNLLFTGEQQNSALSISLPDRLPEISVDSISDTLRALSDSSGQAVPRVALQVAQNPPVPQAVATAQRPKISLQPTPRQLAPKAPQAPPKQPQSRSKKAAAAAAPKALAAKVTVSSPPAPAPVLQGSQGSQGLATLASFAVSGEHVGPSEQTLPSFSSLFSSSRSPLPVPKAGAETVTTSTITAPLPTTSTTTTTAAAATAPRAAAGSKKGPGQGRGQKKGAVKDTGPSKGGSKKDKKGLTTNKEEMSRLLKQAMSLNIRTEEGGVMTGVYPPGQDAPPPPPPPPPHTASSVAADAVSSASVWMVDFPTPGPTVSRQGQHPLQPGLPSYSTAAAPPNQVAHRSLRHPGPAAASSRTTPLSPVLASAPPLPPSVNAGAAVDAQKDVLMMPERRGSKLFNMLQKEGRPVTTSSGSAFRAGIHAPQSTASSYLAPVCRQQLVQPTNTLGGARSVTIPNAYGDSAVLGSSMRSTLSSHTETVAASASTKHHPLQHVTQFGSVGGSGKDGAGMYPRDPTAGSLASWTPAVSYSVLQTAGRPADVTSKPAVARSSWSSPVAPAVGAAPAGDKGRAGTVSPAVPSIVYDNSSYPSASSAAQSIPATHMAPLGVSGVGDSPLSQSQSMQQSLADPAASFASLIGGLPEGAYIEAHRTGNKPFATYRCLICSKAFMTLDNLREHVKRNCKPPSEEPESQEPSASAISGKAPAPVGGLETSTVFQCMRCFELCISEAGIRAHKQVCSKAPKPKPKPKPKSRAKPKQPKSEEEQATEARVMELLNKCLGQNREKLTGQNKAAKAKDTGPKKKPPAKRKVSTDSTQSGQSTEAPKPKKSKKEKAKTPAQNSSDVTSPSGPNLPVPAVLQHDQPTPDGAFRLKPAVEGAAGANPLPHQPATGVVPTGDSQRKEEKPKPKRKYYPKKKKAPAADVAAGSSSLPDQKKESGEPDMASKAPKSKRSSSNSSSKRSKPDKSKPPKPPQKPQKEVPPQPRFKQLSGSGGRSFYKCLNCGQTLCSIENFNDHWSECIQKKPPVVVKPKHSSKEKKHKSHKSGSSSRTPSSATYSSLASIDAIIQSVASGSCSSDMLDPEHLMNFTENLAGNPDTASYLEVTSAAGMEGDGSNLAPCFPPPSDNTLGLVTDQFPDQSDRGTVEGNCSRATVGNGGGETQTVTGTGQQPASFSQLAALFPTMSGAPTQLASSFHPASSVALPVSSFQTLSSVIQPVSSFQMVSSDPSSLLVSCPDSVPAFYTTTSGTSSARAQPSHHMPGSQPVQYSAAVDASRKPAGAGTVHAHAASLAPQEMAPFTSAPSWQTAVSGMLPTQTSLLLGALSSTPAVGEASFLPTTVASPSAQLETQPLQQDTRWEILSPQVEAMPKTEQDSVPQGKMHESSAASQMSQNKSLPSLKSVRSEDTLEIHSSVSLTARSRDLSLTTGEPKKGFEVDSGTVSGQMERETSNQETDQMNSAPSTAAKPEAKSGSKSQKTPGSAKQRSRSVPKKAKENGKKPRSDSAPRPASSNKKQQPSTLTDGEGSSDITAPNPAVSSDGKGDPEVSPTKPTDPPPQDIKDVKYCKMCNRYYSRPWALVRHFAGQHVQALIQLKEDGTRYFCPFCEGVFAQKHLFRAHVMIHADTLLHLFLDEESLALGSNKNASKQASSRRPDVKKIDIGSEQTSKDSTPASEAHSVEESKPSKSVPTTKKRNVQGVRDVSGTGAETHSDNPSLEAGSDPVEGQSTGGSVVEKTSLAAGLGPVEGQSTGGSVVEKTPLTSPVTTPVQKSARKPKSKPVKSVDSKKQTGSRGGKESRTKKSSVESGKDSTPNKADEAETGPLQRQASENNLKDKKHPLQIPEIIQLGKFCRVCQRTFDRNWVLMQHIIRNHVHLFTTQGEGQRLRYCCNLCNEVFVNKSKYMEHSPQHYKLFVQEFNKIQVPEAVASIDAGQTEDVGAGEKKATVSQPVLGSEASVPPGEHITVQAGVPDNDTASGSDDAFPADAVDVPGKQSSQAAQSENAICAEPVSTDEQTDNKETSAEPVSTNEQNDKCQTSSEPSTEKKNDSGHLSVDSMSTDEKVVNSKTPAESDHNNRKNRAESVPSTPKRLVTRNMAASLKKADSPEDAPVSEGMSEDGTEVCVSGASAAQVSGLNTDSSELDKSMSPTTTTKKTVSSDSAVSPSDGTKEDNMQPSETEQSSAGSSAASAVKSHSADDDSQPAKKTLRQFQRRNSKRKDGLKRKSGGIQKRSKNRHQQKMASESKVNYCKVCCRSFCRNWVLAQHITSQHLHPYTMKDTRSGTSYQCHLCKKVYLPKGTYMYHVASHANEIIEIFNSTDSLKEVRFDGRLYRITIDSSEMVVPANLDHSPPASLNRAQKDGHKKREINPARSSSSSPTKSTRSSSVKSPSPSRNRRKTSTVSVSQSHNSVSPPDSPRTQSPTEPTREISKRKTVVPVSKEQKTKRARIGRPSRVKSQNKVKKHEASVERKEDLTSACLPGDEEAKSDKPTGEKEEKLKEEADAAASLEREPSGTQCEEANSDKGEGVYTETFPEPDQGQPDSKSKEPRQETCKEKKKTSDEDRGNDKPDKEAKATDTQYLISVVDSKPEDAKTEDPETDVEMNKLKQNTEAGPSCAESGLVTAGMESSVPCQNDCNEDRGTEADHQPESAKESVSAAEELSLAKAVNKNCSGESIVLLEKLENVQEGSSVFLEQRSPLLTNPSKPSFLDSFRSFVSTRSPLPINRGRRRFFSGGADELSDSERASRQKGSNKEWPAENATLSASAAKPRAEPGAATTAPSVFTAQDSASVRTRSRSRSLEHSSTNRRKDDGQFSSQCSQSDIHDGELGEEGSCGQGVVKPSSAAQVGKEQCGSTSGLEGTAASLSTHTGHSMGETEPSCSGVSGGCLDSVSSYFGDSVKRSESVAQPVSALPQGDSSGNTLRTVHGPDNALSETSSLPSEGRSSQKDMHQTSELREQSPNFTPTVCEGVQEEMVTESPSVSLDFVRSPPTSCDSTEQETTAEKMSLVDTTPACDQPDESAEGIAVSVTGGFPPHTTLSGIIHDAIDKAYHQDAPTTGLTTPFLLPALMESDNDCHTVSSKGEHVSGDGSSDGSSDRRDVTCPAGHALETVRPPKLLPLDSTPAGEDMLVDLSARSVVHWDQAAQDRGEVGGMVTRAQKQPVGTPDPAAAVSSGQTVSAPQVQQQSLTLPGSGHSCSDNMTEDKSSAGKDATPVLSTNTQTGPDRSVEETISDSSEFSHAAAVKLCLELNSESLQKSISPVTVSKPSETATENKVSSCGGGVGGGTILKSDNLVEDSGDTSNDTVNIIRLSDPQSVDKCQSVESEDRKDLSEEQGSDSGRTEASKLLEHSEQKTELSESDVEENFELEDDSCENVPLSAESDPSSLRESACASSDVTMENIAAHNTLSSTDTTADRAREHSCIEGSSQNAMGVAMEAKNPSQETVVASSRGTVATTSHSTRVRRKKLSYADADTDLPDLCIETDPQTIIVTTKAKPADCKQPEPLPSSPADQALKQEPRFGSGEANLVSLDKRSVPFPASKDNPDVVVSAVVGEYEVTVKNLASNKMSGSALQQTYCTTKMEVKQEQAEGGVKGEGGEPPPPEVPVRKPMLGVKPLRSVLPPESFVWDVEGEEEGRRKARNERSLRAFQQKVNVAPFMWEVGEAGDGRGRARKAGIIGSGKAVRAKRVDGNQEGSAAASSSTAVCEKAGGNAGTGAGTQSTLSSGLDASSCAENSNCGHEKPANNGLQSSDDKDSDHLEARTANLLGSVGEEELTANNDSQEKTEGDGGSDVSVSTRRNKTAVNHSEGGGSNPEKMTRARASVSRGHLTTRSRTLRSGSSELMRKRPRVSSSRERTNELSPQKPFRKSRSFDNYSDHSVGLDSDGSSSARSEHWGSGNSLDVQPEVTVSTRSRPPIGNSQLYTHGQKFTQHKFSTKGQVRNRSGLRSGLDRNGQKKAGRNPRTDESDFPNHHDNSKSEPSQPNSSVSNSSKPRLRHRSSDKADRDRSSEKSDGHPTANPPNKQDSSKAESRSVAASESGTEAKVLRSRDITPDKGASSHQESASQHGSDSEPLLGIRRTRSRRPSSSPSPIRGVWEEGGSEGGKSLSLSGLERRGKGPAHKLPTPQPNLSAMVRRRRQQHPAHWHKAAAAVAKPAKKRQPLSPQAPQFEIIRVEPLREDSDSDLRRTRSSDREADQPPRTVHTRVSVDAVRPSLNSPPSRLAPPGGGEQKWSMKRHLNPADIRKKSADPRFPFSFKRAKRKADFE